MGIVIINGKRYDSVTGLMVSERGNGSTSPAKEHTHTATVQTTATAPSSDAPDWVVSYVDGAANKGSAPRVETTVANSSAGEESMSSRAATAQSARRGVTESHTLNRRFVRKPLADGKYAEPIAVHQIKLAAEAKQAVAPIQIPEEAQLDAAAKANQDFIPMLTRRQAEGLSRLTKQAPLHERVAKAEAKKAQKQAQSSAKPVPVRLTAPQRDNIDDDDILNERLEQLSKILQNARELDEQDTTVPQRQLSRRPAKASGVKQTKQTNNDADKSRADNHTTRRARRKFRAPTIFATAGAFAAIAAIGIYVAMPSISVKMAANKAGIDAKNPYAPSGYSIDGEVAYQDGRITINYRSNSGGDGYSVTQEANDSATEASIQQEVSAKNNGYYQEMQVGDKTIYLYRDIATWIDNGMQYTINTNDYLDNQEITDIANSL